MGPTSALNETCRKYYLYYWLGRQNRTKFFIQVYQLVQACFVLFSVQGLKGIFYPIVQKTNQTLNKFFSQNALENVAA